MLRHTVSVQARNTIQGTALVQGMDLDLSAYSGIALQVEGDGQTYKLNLKTADQENVPEDTFQATFDTVAGVGQHSQLLRH